MNHVRMQYSHFRSVTLVMRVEVKNHGLTHVHFALLLGLQFPGLQLRRRKSILIDGTRRRLTRIHRRVHSQVLALLFSLSCRIVGEAFTEPTQPLAFLRRLSIIACQTIKVVAIKEAMITVAML